MKRATIFILAIALISVLAATPAMAGTRTIELSAGSPQLYDAWGMAATNTRGRVERFMVRTDASLPNGSVVVVSIEVADPPGLTKWIDVARAEIQLGTAMVIFNNRDHISPVFPVNEVLRVRVSYRGKAFLSGDFSRF